MRPRPLSLSVNRQRQLDDCRIGLWPRIPPGASFKTQASSTPGHGIKFPVRNGEESCEAIVDFDGSGVSAAACRYLAIVESRHWCSRMRTPTSRKLGKPDRTTSAT